MIKAGLGPKWTEALSTESLAPRTVSLIASHVRENIHAAGESIIAEKVFSAPSAKNESVRGTPSSDTWSVKEGDGSGERRGKNDYMYP